MTSNQAVVKHEQRALFVGDQDGLAFTPRQVGSERERR
jgi:hypothetical protein